MPRLGLILLVLAFLFALEQYSFTGLSLVFHDAAFFQYSYWVVTIITFIGFFKAYFDYSNNKVGVRPILTNLLLGFGFSVIVGKILFIGLLVLQDSGRFLIGLINLLSSFFIENHNRIPVRNYEVTFISALAAGIPFVSMIYGITFGKYKYEVEQVKLTFPELPKAFHKFRILQISDIHAGSFDSLEKVKQGIDLIKAQQADLIVFTGDLVNSLKDEIDPFIDLFASLSAPYGMYSILGNHDYYGLFQILKKDTLERKIYWDGFKSKHEAIGFKLLNNESVLLNKENESIRLIGVENWGSGPFPKNGDLNKALEGVQANEFSILLSHDPTHWDHHVLPNKKKIHLTLSGHTHGMQFGFKIGNFKWSPIKYRYKRWMGLYRQADQLLYINRGFGFLAWPGRVGMSPEITVIELLSH